MKLLQFVSPFLMGLWSKPHFRITTLSKDEMVTNICPYEGGFFYMDERSYTLRHRMKERVWVQKSPSKQILDMDMGPHGMMIAHPRQNHFTVSFTKNITIPFLPISSLVHRFPILHSSFLDNGRILCMSSNGEISITNLDTFDIRYMDLGFPMYSVRRIQNDIYIDTEDGIYHLDITTFQLQLVLPKEWNDSITSFYVHHNHIMTCTSEGGVSIWHNQKKKWYWKSSSLQVLDCFLDDYKCVLACSDGSIRIGNSQTFHRSYEIHQVFKPHSFKRIRMDHQRLYCDGTQGFQYYQWFHKNYTHEIQQYQTFLY